MNSFYIALIGFLLLSGVTGQGSSVEPSPSPTPSEVPSSSSETSAAPSSSPVTTTAYITTSGPSTTAVSYFAKDNTSGVVCIVLNATIKFSLPYVKADTNTTATADVYLPAGGSTAQSSCGTVMASKYGQLLKVTGLYDDWTLQVFYQNFTSNFAATMLQLDYTVKDGSMFPGASSTSVKASVSYSGSEASPLFSKATISGYYFCSAESSVNLNSTTTINGKVTFSGLTTFAFGTQNNANALTGTKTDCAGDKKPDDYIVPIAVGCALAGVILVVLVAYIIGRYRSRNTYQNV